MQVIPNWLNSSGDSDTDYARIYGALMSRASCRNLVGYSEKHHVVPKCMGGSDSKSNIVRLTAKEHFLAHKLLVRMHPDVRGLWFALVAMGRIAEYKSRIFASERRMAAQLRQGFKYTDESRRKMRESALRRGSNSPETVFQRGGEPWNKGRKAWRKDYSHSGETRAKMQRTKQERQYDHSARMKAWWDARKADLQRIGG